MEGKLKVGVDQVVEWFRESPMAAQIVAEAEKKRLAQRKALVEKISACRRELERDMPALNKALAAADAEVEKRREALKEAETRRRDAYNAAASASHRADREISLDERLLRDTADPAIDAFADAVRDYFNANRATVIAKDEAHLGELHAWAMACHCVRRDCDELKLKPVADVRAELRRLAMKIPKVDGNPQFEWEAGA